MPVCEFFYTQIDSSLGIRIFVLVKSKSEVVGLLEYFVLEGRDYLLSSFTVSFVLLDFLV